jgi:hypothetical protein
VQEHQQAIEGCARASRLAAVLITPWPPSPACARGRYLLVNRYWQELVGVGPRTGRKRLEEIMRHRRRWRPQTHNRQVSSRAGVPCSSRSRSGRRRDATCVRQVPCSTAPAGLSAGTSTEITERARRGSGQSAPAELATCSVSASARWPRDSARDQPLAGAVANCARRAQARSGSVMQPTELLQVPRRWRRGVARRQIIRRMRDPGKEPSEQKAVDLNVLVRDWPRSSRRGPPARHPSG